MYLVSLYFDDKTTIKIQNLIDKVAEKSKNKFMIDNNVPPHITIGAFETNNENEVIKILDKKLKNFKSGEIIFASIGVFKSSVIFLSPVLNEYLHNLSVNIYEDLKDIDNTIISKYYMPFQWMPHTTIAKKLNSEELFLAFEELEKNFNIFNGSVTKIGLSKTNPYEDIKLWDL